MARVVVVGAGHGGVQLAASLRDHRFPGPVTLVDSETRLPYERPPLSKHFMDGPELQTPVLRSPEYFRTHDIELRSGVSVAGIDRAGRRIHTSDGSALPYDHLVLATGAAPRRPPVRGIDLAGVHVLRSADDARALRASLSTGGELAVVGGGFIGLEVAAAAARRGIAVTVVEMAGRVMERSVSPEVSACFERHHRETGVAVRLAQEVRSIDGRDGHVVGLTTADGSFVPARTVLVGAGVAPRSELAVEAGLEVAGGIVVDEQLSTADPRISAIGDCAVFPGPSGALIRLESIQNASDQARAVAARIAGAAGAAYAAVPWFWSVQGSRKLQIVGLGTGVQDRVTRGDPTGRYSVFGFRDDVLVTVESVNDPTSYILGRKLLESRTTLRRDGLGGPDVDFKSAARSAMAQQGAAS